MHRRILSVISLLIVPYLFIVVINNFFAVKLGFYKISDDVLLMLFFGFLLFFIGTTLADFQLGRGKIRTIIKLKQKEDKFKCYRMKEMFYYVVFVEAIVVGRLIYTLVKNGILYIISEGYEGMLFRGILGHVFLTIYPLIPILFYYWLKDKKRKKYLFASLFGVLLIFLTLVKYHCIGMLVLIFFFISLEESKYIKKGIILLVILVIFVFVLNYFFVFSVKGTTNLVSNSFYFNHLWNYVAGSLIYDNYIFSGDIDILHNVGYRFFSLFVAPINLFVRKFTGKAIFTCGIREFQFMGINGERGNVVDMIGYLFPVEQSIKEYIIFGLVIITLGYIFNMVYRRMINIEKHFLIFVASFLTFFIFFSFFGPFYVNFTPWEILAWSFIMLKIFDNRLKIVFKKSI